MIYWVELNDGRTGCIETREGEELDIVAHAELGAGVAEFDKLPYPASPGLRRVTECPDFCYSPNICKGRSSCPNAPCCTS